MPHIDVDGVQYAYAEWGSGPLVVFFHGTLSGKNSFAKTVVELPPGYRCVAFDWPGHGESTYNPDGWSVDDLVDAVPALVAGLGEKKAVLVGLSQGGAIGLRVALRYPDLLAALVTINAGADPVGPEAAAMIRKIGQALRDGSDAERREAAEQITGVFHAPGWPEGHPELADEEIQLILGHPREAAVHVTYIPATYGSIEDRLPKISCPTLVIWGERDARRERGPRMVQAIPNSELRVIPGVGHLATLEAPKAMAEALSEFLAGLELSDVA